MKTLLVNLSESSSIEVLEDTQIVLDFSTLSKVDGVAEVEVRPLESNLTIEILGVFKNAEGRLDLKTTARTENTKVNIFIRGFKEDSKELAISNTGIVEEKAAGSLMVLDNKIITENDVVAVEIQPNLVIKKRNIEQASHNLAIGKIDEKQVYYLMARGVDEDEAKKTILNGVFEEVIDKIADKKIKAKVEEYVRK